MGTLTGRTALVTGGSRGIGRAVSERLGREGARVAVHYGRDAASAELTVKEIRAAGGDAFAIRAELGAPGDAEALWAAFDEQAGEGLDILVNNAGIVGPRAPLGEVAPEDYDRIFAVNTRAPFFITQHGLARLRDGGRVINLSTALTRGAALPDLIAYTMTKGAVDAFTSVLAKQLGERGITVNAVAPGVIDTDMNASWLRAGAEVQEGTAALSPLRRVGEARDVGDVVAFLASDDSRWVTGQWIDTSGGALL
ncbi:MULTISPECIES: SDR family oxidoreductase [Streptomyces]|uniref:SDR family oxidoreductase n=1 Tax=Streptomyces TaxID=1883 RepID=UPI00345BBBB9